MLTKFYFSRVCVNIHVRYITGSNSGGTLTRQQANSPYRTPAPPVSPPSVPSNYAPSYIAMQRQISQQQAAAAAAAGHHGNISTADRKSGYAPVGNIQVAQVCALIVPNSPKKNLSCGREWEKYKLLPWFHFLSV